jgi:hypothetical protein
MKQPRGIVLCYAAGQSPEHCFLSEMHTAWFLPAAHTASSSHLITFFINQYFKWQLWIKYHEKRNIALPDIVD